MSKKQKKKATDMPLRFFQNTCEDGVVSYMETQKHYFYRHTENTFKRISGEEYLSALEAHLGL